MGQAKPPPPVKVVISMLTAHPGLWDAAAERLQALLGPADLSEAFPFDHTNYYQEEFGAPLARRFLIFHELIAPDRLPEIKNLTNELESALAEGGKRRINLDPGYISLSKLVLATTKNHAHRLYLGQGIYGEVTLRYQHKAFAPWPWTYPDYASQPYLAFFGRIRAGYVAQIGEAKRDGA